MMRKISVSLLFFFLTICSFAQQTQVLTGIEILKKTNFEQLNGLRIGLITNQTGVDNNLNSTIDLLFKAENVELAALFGPEHGVRGDIDGGKKVKSYQDKKTNVPVYSLYGKDHKPSPEMLENIDALVYDIQDIGCRSYTYITTMGLAMEAAAENGIKFFVLDRPNPLGGVRIEGNIPEDKYLSFISKYKIPYIYGLTCGELATLINEESWLEKGLKCDLNVIKMQNWSRDMLFTDCNLIWVPSSPHIPKVETAFYYPATGVIGEFRKDFNIGVGYTLPFEMILAEGLSPEPLVEKLSKKFDSKDIVFRGTSVIPYYTSYKGKQLTGIQIYIKNYNLNDLMWIQFAALEEILKQKPELKEKLSRDTPQARMFDKAVGTDKIRKLIAQNNFSEIKMLLDKDIKTFKTLSRRYFLY